MVNRYRAIVSSLVARPLSWISERLRRNVPYESMGKCRASWRRYRMRPLRSIRLEMNAATSGSACFGRGFPKATIVHAGHRHIGVQSVRHRDVEVTHECIHAHERV